jgi:hypothetical protein
MSIEQSRDRSVEELAGRTTAYLSNEAVEALEEIKSLQNEREASEDEIVDDSIALHLKIVRAVSSGGELLIRNSRGWEKVDIPRF